MTPAFTQQAIVAVGQIMRLAAREIIMPAFGRLGPEAIRCKSGPLDLVTDADEAAERFITTRLRDAFPAARVVGEEAVAADPGVLAVLDAPGLVFVIDPIDGTANYAAGVPLFGVMVAAVQDGVTVGGAILDPVTDRLALAVRGGGAWEDDGHGHRCGLRAASAAAPPAMTGMIAWRYLPEPWRDAAPGLIRTMAGAWDYRCAAHAYLTLVRGVSHLALFGRTQPWDHLAGTLIHAEAGGYAACLDATPYGARAAGPGLLCAPDRVGWSAVRGLLEPSL